MSGYGVHHMNAQSRPPTIHLGPLEHVLYKKNPSPQLMCVQHGDMFEYTCSHPDDLTDRAVVEVQQPVPADAVLTDGSPSATLSRIGPPARISSPHPSW
mmetsp:Transcript_33065/g.54062  ORF Transcript_33065/g.54062 Transcript_33065/m.54062 type:complete len:99 (+) Transcript_33065:773-1069(+)